MALRRTKLLGIQNITGISTVGILTVGTTATAGGVGIASTTYLRGVVMHNTGLGTCTATLYVYPSSVSSPVTGVGITNHRLAKVDLAPNETFFFEVNYPIVLTSQEKVVISVDQPGPTVGGSGIGTVLNVQIVGDTDI